MSVNFGDEYARQEAVREELLSDETVQWTGQPDPSIIFSKSDVYSIPMGLIFAGFSLFALWDGVLERGKHAIDLTDVLVGLVFVIPFVVLGQYLVWGRFIHKVWRKRRTIYAVTNKRVIILTVSRSKTVSAAFIRDIPTVNKSISRSGTGTVAFGNASLARADFMDEGSRWTPVLSPIFHDIRDANTVYELVNRLRNEPEAKRY